MEASYKEKKEKKLNLIDISKKGKDKNLLPNINILNSMKGKIYFNNKIKNFKKDCQNSEIKNKQNIPYKINNNCVKNKTKITKSMISTNKPLSRNPTKDLSKDNYANGMSLSNSKKDSFTGSINSQRAMTVSNDSFEKN